MRKCKNGWFKSYLELTAPMESPLAYHLWSAAAIISAAMDRDCYFDMRKFKVHPNMFIVLTGPTGIKKSSASNYATRIFRQAFGGVGKTAVIEGKITGPRMIMDLGLSYVASGQSRAFVHAPEFKVFTNSTMGSDTLLEDMTTYWDCPDTFEYRLKHAGVTTMDNVYVTLLGCSTPEWLECAGTKNFIDSGFSSRIIYVYKDKNERRVHRPVLDPGDSKLKDDLLHDLHAIAALRVAYDWTSDGDEWMKNWYENEDWRVISDKRMRGYIERKQIHLIKLTMLLKAAFGDDHMIGKAENVAALKMLEAIEPGLTRVYRTIGQSTYSRLVQKIIDIAQSGHSLSIPEMVKHLGKATPRRDIEEAVNTLVVGGVLVEDVKGAGFGGGRVIKKYTFKGEDDE